MLLSDFIMLYLRTYFYTWGHNVISKVIASCAPVLQLQRRKWQGQDSSAHVQSRLPAIGDYFSQNVWFRFSGNVLEKPFARYHVKCSNTWWHGLCWWPSCLPGRSRPLCSLPPPPPPPPPPPSATLYTPQHYQEHLLSSGLHTPGQFSFPLKQKC